MPLAYERRRGRPVAAVVALAVAGRLACAQRVGAVVHCAGAVHDLGLPLVRHGKGLAWGLVLGSGSGLGSGLGSGSGSGSGSGLGLR